MHPNADEYCGRCVIPQFSGRGRISLWKFLLQSLMDRTCQNCITWTGNGWEFKFIDPEEVARRWGRFKSNNPTMSYKNLSRSIRCYYKTGLIKKSAGKKYAYRFTDDVQQLIRFRNCSNSSECVITCQIPSEQTSSNLGGSTWNQTGVSTWSQIKASTSSQIAAPSPRSWTSSEPGASSPGSSTWGFENE